MRRRRLSRSRLSIFIIANEEYWFSEVNNPRERFNIKGDIIGSGAKFLKENQEVLALEFKGQVINIKLPIKVDLRVKETTSGEKGDTASGGRKVGVLETGAKVMLPLFINEGDVVRVNVVTGEYSERVAKS